MTDPSPEGRSARHLQLPVDCRFCHAPVGDLVHCLSFFLHEHLKAVKDINKPSLKTHSRGQAYMFVLSLHFLSGRRVPVRTVCALKAKSDVATAFAAAQDNIAPQRIRHACSARFCKIAVLWRALALANCDTNDLISSDQRPPTSIASTTNFAWETWAANSGYVRSWRLLADCNTTPSASAAAPCEWRAQMRVVSTAN